jgi:hypothetical protein
MVENPDTSGAGIGDSGREQEASKIVPREIVTPTSGSRTLKMASFLVIIAGVLCLGNGLETVFVNSDVNIIGGGDVVGYCGVLVFVSGIGAIICGVASLTLRRVSPALAGAVLGIAGGGLIGFWLGIAAIVLLVMSHDDL